MEGMTCVATDIRYGSGLVVAAISLARVQAPVHLGALLSAPSPGRVAYMPAARVQSGHPWQGGKAADLTTRSGSCGRTRQQLVRSACLRPRRLGCRCRSLGAPRAGDNPLAEARTRRVEKFVRCRAVRRSEPCQPGSGWPRRLQYHDPFRRR